jgi:hypothetical protein
MEEVREAVGHHRLTGSRRDSTRHHVHAQVAPLIRPLILRVFEDRFESLWQDHRQDGWKFDKYRTLTVAIPLWQATI